MGHFALHAGAEWHKTTAASINKRFTGLWADVVSANGISVRSHACVSDGLVLTYLCLEIVVIASEEGPAWTGIGRPRALWMWLWL